MAAASAAGRCGAPSYRAASSPIDESRESCRALPEAVRSRGPRGFPGGAYYNGTGFVITPDGYALAVPTWHIIPIPLRQKLGIE